MVASVELADGTVYSATVERVDIDRWEAHSGRPFGPEAMADAAAARDVDRFLAWAASRRQGLTGLPFKTFRQQLVGLGVAPRLGARRG